MSGGGWSHLPDATAGERLGSTGRSVRTRAGGGARIGRREARRGPQGARGCRCPRGQVGGGSAGWSCEPRGGPRERRSIPAVRGGSPAPVAGGVGGERALRCGSSRRAARGHKKVSNSLRNREKSTVQRERVPWAVDVEFLVPSARSSLKQSERSDVWSVLPATQWFNHLIWC